MAVLSWPGRLVGADPAGPTECRVVRRDGSVLRVESSVSVVPALGAGGGLSLGVAASGPAGGDPEALVRCAHAATYGATHAARRR